MVEACTGRGVINQKLIGHGWKTSVDSPELLHGFLSIAPLVFRAVPNGGRKFDKFST